MYKGENFMVNMKVIKAKNAIMALVIIAFLLMTLIKIILVGKDNVKLKPGKLADLAPTMLDIMGLEKPEEMTGESLIIK